eukprot:c16258_g1_i2.p1 GENE.c16258_g1_i2~~c16258_g1_i2.p1  ORF type:complete len:787 (+),score=186.68 c16258_g1_i2:225-2585(+)
MEGVDFEQLQAAMASGDDVKQSDEQNLLNSFFEQDENELVFNDETFLDALEDWDLSQGTAGVIKSLTTQLENLEHEQLVALEALYDDQQKPFAPIIATMDDREHDGHASELSEAPPTVMSVILDLTNVCRSLEDLQFWLGEYGRQLVDMKSELRAIELQNETLETQTINNKLLLAALDNMLHSLTLNPKHAAILSKPDFSTPIGINAASDAAKCLSEVLSSVASSQLAEMAVVHDRLTELSSVSTIFSGHVRSFFFQEFRRIAASIPTTPAREPSVLALQQLIKYSPITKRVAELSPDIMHDILTAFNKEVAPPFNAHLVMYFHQFNPCRSALPTARDTNLTSMDPPSRKNLRSATAPSSSSNILSSPTNPTPATATTTPASSSPIGVSSGTLTGSSGAVVGLSSQPSQNLKRVQDFDSALERYLKRVGGLVMSGEDAVRQVFDLADDHENVNSEVHAVLASLMTRGMSEEMDYITKSVMARDAFVVMRVVAICKHHARVKHMGETEAHPPSSESEADTPREQSFVLSRGTCWDALLQEWAIDAEGIFGEYIERQVKTIRESHFEARRAGVLPLMQRFPMFVSRFREALKGDYSLADGFLYKMCDALFTLVHTTGQSNPKYTHVVRLENFYFFYHHLREENSSALQEYSTRAQESWTESMGEYIEWIIDSQLGPPIRYFAQLATLFASMDTDVLYQERFSKAAFQRMYNQHLTLGALKQSTEMMAKRVHKHLSPTSGVEQLVWSHLDDAVVEKYKAWQAAAKSLYNIDMRTDVRSLCQQASAFMVA